MQTKRKLNFLSILNMNVGFFGIQFSFGLQQSNMSPIYSYLGADPENLAILWLAGPITGLIVQPIIGAMSDGTWSPRFGRRKPFFLVGAILASIALIAMPYSSSVWMAASLLWILDAANNIAMEPYRALVTDVLPEKQHSLGFLMQSFFTGLGTTLANFSPAILASLGWLSLTDRMDNGIPTFTYWAFGIGAFASIATVLYSVLTTKEYPPSEEELAKIKAEKEKGNALKRTFHDVKIAFTEMPLTMKYLIPVQFFTWFGMFCYWQYITLALSSSLYDTIDPTSEEFPLAQAITGNMNGGYNIVCFLVAFLLVPIANKLGAKMVHFICLMAGGLGLIFMPYLSSDTILFSIPNIFGEGSFDIAQIYLISFGLGLAWASMLAIPYKILASSIPASKTGVYMGIFNMFIVVPMIIQIFVVQYFLYDFLGSNPENIILVAGICLILAAFFTLIIKDKLKELY